MASARTKTITPLTTFKLKTAFSKSESQCQIPLSASAEFDLRSKAEFIIHDHARHHKEPNIPSISKLAYLTIFLAYWHFLVAIIFSYFREMERIIREKIANWKNPKQDTGYAPIFERFNTFFEREMYGRINDLWFRPISSNPGAYIDVIEREDTHPLLIKAPGAFKLKDSVKRCLNLSSYNYLGFSETTGPCVEADIKAIDNWGTILNSSRVEVGSCPIHLELERKVARYVGKEDAIVFGMGFATNSTTLPALCDKNTLIVSDSLNHASIIVGCRGTAGARIRVFKHNNPAHLEKVLKKAITQGQPRTNNPWKKILIITEGIFSMEGEILRLPEIVALKKKYKAYLWVDEAHSIGALGASGRGVCEYWGIDPSEVDILMGTFTKSFAAVGGYIAGDKGLINYLRTTAYSSLYDCGIAPPMAQQIISSMEIISGDDGTNEGAMRLQQLRDNVNQFRQGLAHLGFDVIGDDDSPVVPMMIYVPNKMPAFSRMCLEQGIATVMACYPVTDLMLSRARFCVSAAHTKEDIEKALKTIADIGDLCMLRYYSNTSNK